MAFVWFNPWNAPEGQPHPRTHHRRHHGPQPPAAPAADGAAAPAPAPAQARAPQPPVAEAPTAPPRDAPAPPQDGPQAAPDRAAPPAAATQAAATAAPQAAAEPVPMPGPETLQKYQQTEEANHKAEDSLLSRFEGFIQQKKDQVFSLWHYVFGGGDAPAPEKTPEGTPRLEQGGETAEQRTQRLAWEEAQKKTLNTAHDGENQALVQKAQQEASQFNNPYDPTQNRRMYDSYTRLQGEEDAMKRRQAEEMSRIGIAGLPDPSVPGRTLSQFVDDGWANYDRLVATNKDSLANSPEGRQVNAYVNYVLDTPYGGWGGGGGMVA